MKQNIMNILLFLTFASLSFTQEGGSRFRNYRARKSSGFISGEIRDSQHRTPIEYANIILFTRRDSNQVTGTITDQNGHFHLDNLRPGIYYMDVRFMGYTKERVDEVKIASVEDRIDLGIIYLKPVILNMEGIAVEADKPVLTYEIDKKVVNVGHMQTAISGTAVEVLENVPSVTVDIEGNVSLRGSENFTVLIDSRPTVLDPRDALEQIPASTIESIEIITNPSAKYDPDGNSGIINIIMKKGKNEGFSGLMNLDGGINNKYGGNFLIENRSHGVRLWLGIDYGNRIYFGDGRSENRTTHDGITSFIYADGESNRTRVSGGLRTGLEFKLGQKDILGLDARYGTRNSERDSDEHFEERSDYEPQPLYYISDNLSKRSGDYYSTNLSYKHDFPSKDHELLGQINYRWRDSDEISENELFDETDTQVSGRQTTEAGLSNRLRITIDYTLPFSNEQKFEAGMQSQFNLSDEQTGLSDYDTLLTQYHTLDNYSKNTRYRRNTHSLYSLYSNKFGRFGFQGGLRGEYTDRIIEIKEEGEEYIIDRWDYFPTVHLSCQFAGEKQLMASYTRRIDRPRGYYLEPFETWRDAYNVRIGNPSIKPEYIDSYELGFQTNFGQNMFSTELYYRVNHNKIERVRSVYDVNITLHTVENVGTDYAFGSEFLFNMDLLKSWNMNFMGNLYDYRIKGTLYNETFTRKSFNYSIRMNNVFKLGRFIQIQLNGRYNSPRVSSQGERKGFFMTDMAIKKEFFDRFLSMTLQVRDIFKQGKYEFTSEGPDFYQYARFTRESPIVMLNIRINFNNYKTERRRQNGDDQNGLEDEGEY